MQKKSQKQRKKIQPPVYYEFQKAKGIDGANLAKYYQPNQPHYHLERFNRMELGRLQNTVKREKFDWFITFWGFVGGFIGILKPNRFNLLVILINVIAWWGILIVEFSGSLIRHSPWFLIWLIFLVPFMIENQLHIYWKTRDRIELSKLTERSMFLETRLCSTIVNYIKANIVFILILRWRFEHSAIKFIGNGLESTWMWLATAFDNMIILLAMLDYASVLNYSGLSSIKPSGLWATIMIWMIIAFNHFIGLESIKCILQVLDEKGNLPQMLKRPLKLMQRFL